jgi:hypothetical protein
LKDAGLAKNAKEKARAAVTSDYCYFNAGWFLLSFLPFHFSSGVLFYQAPYPHLHSQQEGTVLPQVGVENGAK